MATRIVTGSGMPPTAWLVVPNISVPGAGTAAAPAGALGVRSVNGLRYVRQPVVRTRAVPVAASAASVPVSVTRT